jgi:hypothetical protein
LQADWQGSEAAMWQASNCGNERTAKNPDETQFVSGWSESSLHSFDEGE